MLLMESEAAAHAVDGADAPNFPGAPIPAELRRVVERTAEFVLGTCEYERTDRLCPAHFQVYLSNPMNVSYGAAGIALFLHRALGELHGEVRKWMLAQPLGSDTYPPGLFLGLSGVAWALAEVGLPEKGEEVMRKAYRSPLLYDEPGVFLGAAGWGLASLYFWELTGRDAYLDRAVEAGEHLLATALPEGETRFWKYRTDDKVHYGYGYGSTGIAWFLLKAGLASGRDDFLAAAAAGLEYDWEHRLDTSNGVSWKRFEDDAINYPYFIHGAAGIGSVTARFAELLRSDALRLRAMQIADAVDMKWTVHPGTTSGVCSLGEMNIDLYRHAGERRFLERAYDQADTVLWFRIERPEGVAFPGRMLLKICNDWATGAAGIGLYLLRLLAPGPRPLVDFDAPRA